MQINTFSKKNYQIKRYLIKPNNVLNYKLLAISGPIQFFREWQDAQIDVLEGI